MNETNTVPPSILKIQERVAAYFNLSVNEMISEKRHRYVVRPRQVAMHLASELTRHSCSQIGRCFNKDHTTVFYANTEIPCLMVQDLKLDKDVRVLKAELANVDKRGDEISVELAKEISVELAVDMLVELYAARLRCQLMRLAKADPSTAIEMLKALDTSKQPRLGE